MKASSSHIHKETYIPDNPNPYKYKNQLNRQQVRKRVLENGFEEFKRFKVV